MPDVKIFTAEPSDILNTARIHVLTYHLPGIIRLNKWVKLFSISRDGYSHHTFFDRVEGHDYTILAIKDTKGYLFGAFCTEEWRYDKKFYGDGYSFVFTFREGDDLEIYKASGEDDNF